MLAPLYGPECVPDQSDRADLAAEIADRADIRLHDWQLYVLRAALEQRDGEHVYSTVGIQIARQCGKTLLAHIRVLLGLAAGEQLAYTAQDRLAAREKWQECLDLARQVFGSQRLDIVWANGRETLRVGDGMVRIVTPNERGPRGLTLDCAIIDEAFKHKMPFLSAIMPTLIVRPGSQLWLLSNAGDQTSEMLKHYRDLGRAGTPGVCWLEWAPPEDADASDPETWKQAIPTLGKPDGITMAALIDMHASMPADLWDREMMNRWPVDDGAGVIDMTAWLDMATSSLQHDDDTLCLGAAVNLDRDHASIAAVSVTDGILGAEIIDVADGPVTWLADRLQELSASHSCPVAIDGGGPSGTVCVELAQRGVPLIELRAKQYSRACGLLADRISTGSFAHHEHPLLTNAAATAVKRRLMSAWAWSQGDDLASQITPLEAVTVAAWGAATKEPNRPPSIWLWQEDQDGGET